MNVHMPQFIHACSGFTMLEALMASGVLALGLLGSAQLSQYSLRATEVQRKLDAASGLAQNLAECWGVQTALCLQEFASASSVAPFNTDPSMAFERTWEVKNISIAGAPSGSLQELRIKVRWSDNLPLKGQNPPSELLWVKRRASTAY
jgi:Tfp pilus assembly protein PilV